MYEGNFYFSSTFNAIIFLELIVTNASYSLSIVVFELTLEEALINLLWSCHAVVSLVLYLRLLKCVSLT